MFAIYDIGTNTIDFVLVDLKHSTNTFNLLAEETVQIKLGEGSSISKILQQSAIERCVSQLNNLKEKYKKHTISNHIAIGTAAIRNAKNKIEFLNIIKDKCDINIEVISGEKEAELIFEGIKFAVKNRIKKNSLIIDIGGGSVEFIITNFEQIHFKQSIDIGAIQLWETFNFSDPIKIKEEEVVKNEIYKTCDRVFHQLELFKVRNIIGAAGCFDTFNALLSISELKPLQKFSSHEILSICDNLIKSTSIERENNKQIPSLRKNYIVPAAILIKTILENYPFEDFYTSNFSLREGVVSKLLSDFKLL